MVLMAQEKSNRRVTTTAPSENTKLQKIKYSKEDEPDFYKCPTCGTPYKKLDDNFPASQSELYAGWEYHLPICKRCMDRLFEHYTEVYGGDEDTAIRRICEKFDIYYSVSLLNASRKITKNRSRIHTYISKANLVQYKGKTYDTTLDEERKDSVVENPDDIEDFSQYKLTPKMIKFWGSGYEPMVYPTLQGYYDELLKLCAEKPDVKKQKMMKNLCLLEYQMQINIQAGKDIGTLSNSYKAMFEAAELKTENADISNDAFGRWIMDIEKYCPAEFYQDKKKYHDFFGIVEYIERFMFRPLKNLIFGTKEKEKEYWVNDEDIEMKGGG
jgi:hypothetical protein